MCDVTNELREAHRPYEPPPRRLTRAERLRAIRYKLDAMENALVGARRHLEQLQAEDAMSEPAALSAEEQAAEAGRRG